MYFNPGSEEKLRQDFEEQQSDPDVASQASTSFEGRQVSSGSANENEAKEVQSKFLAQSVVQKSALGNC